jgi:hypothetical protein
VSRQWPSREDVERVRLFLIGRHCPVLDIDVEAALRLCEPPPRARRLLSQLEAAKSRIRELEAQLAEGGEP